MGRKKILLVDDEADILEFVKYNLEKENYKVRTASNGREAIRKAEEQTPDLILLDVMMPEMDGVETCLKMRQIPSLSSTIIAFLTARGEDYSHIAGLEAGADDYITKPIKPRVLVTRIKALLRRQKDMVRDDAITEVQGIRVDSDRYVVIKDGAELNLPKKEFELLALLISKPGKVFTRESIMSNVWGNDVVVGDRTIDVHISKLREKIGDTYFKTVKGVGYKFDG